MKRLVILLLFLVLIQAKATLANSTLAQGQNFLLFYSNDVLGETEPCG